MPTPKRRQFLIRQRQKRQANARKERKTNGFIPRGMSERVKMVNNETDVKRLIEEMRSLYLARGANAKIASEAAASYVLMTFISAGPRAMNFEKIQLWLPFLRKYCGDPQLSIQKLLETAAVLNPQT